MPSRRLQIGGLVTLVTMAPLVCPLKAHAIGFRVESETIGDAYQLVTSRREILTRTRLHQHLMLSIYENDGSGENRWSFQSLFRFGIDLGLSDQELSQVLGLQEHQLSIQYGYLQGEGLFSGLLDVKVGRQLHADGLDYQMFDGALVHLHTPYYLSLELQAGVEVRQALWGLNASQLEVDGTRFVESETQADTSPGFIFGAAILSRNVKQGAYRLGYRRVMSASAVDSERVGFTAYQRLLNLVDVSGQVSYDLYQAQFDRLQFGTRWRLGMRHELDAEYVETLPSFDGDSIFNIFAATAMRDFNLRYRTYLGERTRVHVAGKLKFAGHEAYDGELTAESDDLVEGFGVSAGWLQTFGRQGRAGRLLTEMTWEGGFGGERLFVDIGGLWAVVPQQWEVEGRLTLVGFQDELQRELHALSFGYQVGGRYLLNRRAAFALMAEHNMNRLQTHQFRVFALIDLTMWM